MAHFANACYVFQSNSRAGGGGGGLQATMVDYRAVFESINASPSNIEV